MGNKGSKPSFKSGARQKKENRKLSKQPETFGDMCKLLGVDFPRDESFYRPEENFSSDLNLDLFAISPMNSNKHIVKAPSMLFELTNLELNTMRIKEILGISNKNSNNTTKNAITLEESLHNSPKFDTKKTLAPFLYNRKSDSSNQINKLNSLLQKDKGNYKRGTELKFPHNKVIPAKVVRNQRLNIRNVRLTSLKNINLKDSSILNKRLVILKKRHK